MLLILWILVLAAAASYLKKDTCHAATIPENWEFCSNQPTSVATFADIEVGQGGRGKER